MCAFHEADENVCLTFYLNESELLAKMSSICLPLHQSLSNQSVSNENGSNENCSNGNGSNENCILFVSLDDVTGLPFPLNSNLVLKLLMVSSYVFTLVAGTRIRFQIISFVKCPESSVGVQSTNSFG